MKEVTRTLASKSVPFVVHSGSHVDELNEAFLAGGTVKMPAGSDEVVRARAMLR